MVYCILFVFNTGGVLAIFVTKADGRMLQEYMNSYGVVSVQILEGHLQPPPTTLEPSNSTNISKTSVMFVSISFVVLMIISLAWLVFYYIQRFRYAHAKERLTVSSLKDCTAISVTVWTFRVCTPSSPKPLGQFQIKSYTY